jgi:D-alanyl-D-alanine carboxypeptidase (penicillin-binding protein 5/6)
VRRCLALAVVVVAALAASSRAAAADSAPPPFDARAVLVVNGATGEVLYERNADRRLAMASITKLMTAIVTLERTRPAEEVTVPPLASSIGEATVHLRAGERLSVRDLLAAALVQSANDAAYALAAHVGRGDVDRFVGFMNAKAAELGLDDTHFVRPDGLDAPAHFSSARDIAKLARVAMRDALIRKLVRMRRATIAGGRSLVSWNDLLGSFAGLLGVKTGHTARAGWCQVAAARHDGTTVYAVILGSPTRRQRNADLAELLRFGLDRYARLTVIVSGHRYASAAVPFSSSRLALVAPENGRAVVRVGRPLVERVTAPAVVDLPVRKGERVGEVEVMAGRRVIARRPLVAAEPVPEPSFRDRVGWYAGRTLDEAAGMLDGVLGSIA